MAFGGGWGLWGLRRVQDEDVTGILSQIFADIYEAEDAFTPPRL